MFVVFIIVRSFETMGSAPWQRMRLDLNPARPQAPRASVLRVPDTAQLAKLRFVFLQEGRTFARLSSSPNAVPFPAPVYVISVRSE